MITTSHPLKAAVMGWPISHSLSPRLHGFWLQKYGIAGSYDAIAVELHNLQTTLRALPAQKLRGVNLTVPHKESACTIVDTLDDTARRIGAVNLVVVGDKGQLQGRNTDAYGFSQNLVSNGFIANGGDVLVLGAGGGARAVLVALADMGLQNIHIANRTYERGQRLAQEFSTPLCKITAIEWNDAPQALGDTSLLVNTTSLGMRGQPELDLPLDALPDSATVTDIVYAPLQTGLLRAAQQRGLKTIDGLCMLLHQARPSFAAFFGRDPEVTEELRAYVLAGTH